MKKNISIMILLFFALNALGQRGEKIESLKVGYLTNKLNLDAKTAERFWPVYHQYEDELMAVVRENRMKQNETRNADEILDQEQKALDIKRKYNAIFAKVISPEQLNQLYKSEKDFRQMIINRSQKREMRQQNMQNQGPVPNNRNERRMENRPQRTNTRPLPPQNEASRLNRPQPQPALSNDRKSERMRR